MSSASVDLCLYNERQNANVLHSEKVKLHIYGNQTSNDLENVAFSDMKNSDFANGNPRDLRTALAESESTLMKQECYATKCDSEELSSLNMEVIMVIDSGNCPRLRQLTQMNGFDVNVRDKLHGETYLHRLVRKTVASRESRWVPMVYTLSNAGINLDAKDNKGYTALHLAIRHCLLETMVACLKVGAEADSSHEELISKHTGFFAYDFHNWFRKLVPGFWEAVSDNNAFRVNKLVKSWCRINIQRGGESLVEFARRIQAKSHIVELLVANEASVDFAHATISGDELRMKSLLCDQSVRLDTKDHSNREDIFSKLTPLTLKQAAMKYDHYQILYLLGEPNYLHGTKHTKESTVCSIL